MLPLFSALLATAAAAGAHQPLQDGMAQAQPPGPVQPPQALGNVEDSDEEPDLRDPGRRSRFCARHWSALECWKAATSDRLVDTALVQQSQGGSAYKETRRTIECVRDTFGAERCKYERLCYVGLREDDSKQKRPKRRFYARGAPGQRIATWGRQQRRDDRFWTVHTDDMPDISESLLPNDLDIDLHVIPAEQWDMVQQKSIPSEPAAHMAFTTLALGENGGNNLFHVSAAISGVADAQFHNETGWFPPLTTFYVFNAWGDWIDWTGEMVHQLLPDGATVELVHDVEQTRCWDGAVLYGERPTNIMSGPVDAERFRSRVYSRLGLSPRTTHDEATFPLKVLMFGRGQNNRAVTNPTFSELAEHIRQFPFWWDETVHADDMFTFTIEEELDKRSFKEQVQMFSDADIIVGSHGAGATNILFAHEHTPFIELLPYHFTPPCYRNLAAVCGLPYFSLEAEPLPKEQYRHGFPDDDIKVATAWHGVDEANEAHFHHEYFKFGRISVDVKAFQYIFKTALDQVPLLGFGLRYARESSDPIVPQSLLPLVHEPSLAIEEPVIRPAPCATTTEASCREEDGCQWTNDQCSEEVAAPEPPPQPAVGPKQEAASRGPAQGPVQPNPHLPIHHMTTNGWGRHGAPMPLWGLAPAAVPKGQAPSTTSPVSAMSAPHAMVPAPAPAVATPQLSFASLFKPPPAKATAHW